MTPLRCGKNGVLVTVDNLLESLTPVKSDFQAFSSTAMSDPAQIGRNLKAARRAAGLTQEQAAERSGLSKQAISGQERGAYAPTEANLAVLAALYHTTAAALRYGLASPAPAPYVAVREQPPGGQYRARTKLPPRAYERVYGYLERMRAAGIPDDMIEESERLMVDPLYSKLNKRDIRERSEEDLITDIDAAWSWIREVVEREWGKRLK